MTKLYLGTQELTDVYKDKYCVAKAVSGTTLVNADDVISLEDITAIDNYCLYNTYLNNTNITEIPDFSKVTTIGEYGCYFTFSGCTGLTGSIDLSNLRTVGQCGCNGTFQNCTGITGHVDLSSLTSFSSYMGCASMFAGCTGITSIDLSNITGIYDRDACSRMFAGCTGIVGHIDLSSLTRIQDSFGYCCVSMFYNCIGITSVDMSNLVSVSGYQNEFTSMFYGCTSLTSVDLRSLENFSTAYIATNMFSGCTSLVSMKFESLKSIRGGNTSATSNMFSGCTSLQDVYFYALNANSFGGTTNCFDSIFDSAVDGCTVHFPKRIESTTGTWSGVIAGCGGTNTNVVFDIITTIVGNNGNQYSRQEKNSTNTATAWNLSGVLYYTSGNSEPSVGDNIYSDMTCTNIVTTVDSLS